MRLLSIFVIYFDRIVDSIKKRRYNLIVDTRLNTPFWREEKPLYWGNNTMNSLKIQALAAEEIFTPDMVLNDVSASGRARDWRGKKVANELLAVAYDSVNASKAARLRDCGKCLTYRQYDDGSRVLHSMSSCRVRLCPICTWRRSLKVFSQTSEIVDFISKKYDYQYIMLTLTVQSVSGEQLSDTIDNMMRAWRRMINLKRIASACKGWYRALEITHDIYPYITEEMYNGCPDKHIKSRRKFYEANGLQIGDKNPNYDTFHPHIHALICVNKSYFTSRDYLSHDAWVQAWKLSARLEYTPVVDVRRVQGNTSQELNRAVCEVAKYSVKGNDYIIPDDWDLTVDTVRLLDAALDNRRLVAYGGVLREVKQILKMDDEEDGSLVNVGDNEDEHSKEESYRLVHYWWYSGYRQYYRMGEE